MGKVKVLFLASDPYRENRLALDEETRVITAKIRAADHRDAIELIPSWAVRPQDLQQLLMQHRPHIVHFSGHGTRGAPADGDLPPAAPPARDMVVRKGGPAERLMLMGEGGGAQPMSKAALVHLFDILRDNVHVVLLST